MMMDALNVHLPSQHPILGLQGLLSQKAERALLRMQALKGEDNLPAAVLRNIFADDTARRRDAAALARYVQW